MPDSSANDRSLPLHQRTRPGSQHSRIRSAVLPEDHVAFDGALLVSERAVHQSTGWPHDLASSRAIAA